MSCNWKAPESKGCRPPVNIKRAKENPAAQCTILVRNQNQCDTKPPAIRLKCEEAFLCLSVQCRRRPFPQSLTSQSSRGLLRIQYQRGDGCIETAPSRSGDLNELVPSCSDAAVILTCTLHDTRRLSRDGTAKAALVKVPPSRTHHCACLHCPAAELS